MPPAFGLLEIWQGTLITDDLLPLVVGDFLLEKFKRIVMYERYKN